MMNWMLPDNLSPEEQQQEDSPTYKSPTSLCLIKLLFELGHREYLHDIWYATHVEEYKTFHFAKMTPLHLEHS